MTGQDAQPAWSEADRLAALARYGILDTPPEPAFDEVVHLVADLLHAPIAAVNLIASGRQWFKAEVGLGVREMPLDDSICARAILQPGGLVVPDTTQDPRFDGNPLVTGAPHLRFYAGELLETPDGLPLGTLCVLDTAPRPEGLTPRQRTILRTLARQVTGQLELRRAVAERDRALAGQRSAEALNRQIIDGVTDYAIIGTDPQGRITRWNAGAQRNLGWSADEMLGETAERFFTPEDRAAGRMQAEMRAALDAGRATDERWHLRKSDARFWASGAMMPLRDEAGAATGFVKVLRDRTAERRREQRLAMLLEASAGLLAATDPDEVLGPVLEKGAELLGFDQSYSYVVSPDGRHLRLTHAIGAGDEIRAALAHAPFDLPLCGIVAETQRPLTLDNLQATTDPRYEPGRACGLDAYAGFPLVSGGRLYGVLSFGSCSRPTFDGEALAFFATLARYVSAVRERLDNEAALRGWAETLERRVRERTAERDLFATIFETTDTMIMVCGLRYDLLALNKAAVDEFARIYGVRPRPGDDLLALLADRPEHQAQVRAGWARGLSGEEGTVVEGYGDPRRARPYYEIKFRTLRDGQGGRVGCYQFVTDVTGRLAEQAKLAEAQDALRQSQKMEAVGQLTGGLAHDFNNLLTGIMGSLELLQTRIAQGRTKDVDRYVGAAQGAAKRAAALTHRLLAFSRRQTLDPRPTDVNRLVAGMQELIERTTGPEIAVEPVAGVGLWTTLVDPGQLENALLNLCINARDAMPDGGKLTIETANCWLDERAARARELPPGQYVSLCVSDNGSGMPPEVVARAFDPFFTTKPIGLGTGLGLSMVYGFARQSGGQVRIYSELGQGTMVCLYLPRHAGEAHAPEGTTELSDAPRAGHGETVLVVDDEPTVRMLVAEVLEDLGYTAIEAADGAAGLRVLQSNARIDLLVTDVGLPGGMNGRQVADAARVARPGLRVLFITGYAENAVLSHGHLDPGMHVLTKPFAMDALASRIKELIGSK